MDSGDHSHMAKFANRTTIIHGFLLMILKMQKSGIMPESGLQQIKVATSFMNFFQKHLFTEKRSNFK
ncbi:MAG TPA: hypothetical protein DDZ04_03810 [Parabacteroides sp.]|nr:hypothetical protein [Parabacteroides sp.]